jgi:hypothetical protein
MTGKRKSTKRIEAAAAFHESKRIEAENPKTAVAVQNESRLEYIAGRHR